MRAAILILTLTNAALVYLYVDSLALSERWEMRYHWVLCQMDKNGPGCR